MSDLRVNIGVTGAQQAAQALTSVEQKLKQTAQAGAKTSDAISRLPNASNQATFALTNLSRVAQDAPFGFLGIANNLNPLLESFQRLKATTGTTGGALKALGSQLTGPAGLGLAVGVVSSLLVVFGDKLFGAGKAAKAAKEETDKLAESISGEIVKLTSLVAIAQSANATQDDRVKAIKAINQEYSKYLSNLGIEEVTVGNLQKSYQSIVDSLLRQAVVKGLQSEIETAVKEAAAQIIELEKTLAKQPKPIEGGTAQPQRQFRDLATEIQRFNKAGSDNFATLDRQGELLAQNGTAADIYKKRIESLRVELTKSLEPLFGIISNFSFGDLGINLNKDKVEKEAKSIKLPKLSDLILKVDESDVDRPLFESYGIMKTRLNKFGQQLSIDLDTLIDGVPLGALFNIMPSGVSESLERTAAILGNNQSVPDGYASLTKESEDKLKENQKRLEKFFEQTKQTVNEGLQDLATNSLISVGEVIGEALAGGDMQGAFQSFANIVSFGLQAIGEQLVQIGVAALAAKEALKKLFAKPELAIAAGITLIALASASRNLLNKGLSGRRAAGGGVAGGGSYLVGENGPEIFTPQVGGRIIPNGQLNSPLMTGGGMSGGRVVIRGRELRLLAIRTQNSQIRLSGR